VAFSRATPGLGTRDVWSLDMERSIETRITSAPGDEFHSFWLPDEKTIAYSSSEYFLPNLFCRNVETGVDKQLLPVKGFQIGQDVSPDNASILFTEDFKSIWEVSTSGSGTPSLVLAAGSNIEDFRFSPDGSYIAFVSDESGQPEAYVAPYPGPGQRVRISSDGATALRWNRRFGTIFYSDLLGRIWSVLVNTQPVLRIGKGTPLFTAKSLGARSGTTSPSFDVFPDGKRLLVAIPEIVADELPLTVVMNWPASVHAMSAP
jgi:Tol biopolymer transport system component